MNKELSNTIDNSMKPYRLVFISGKDKLLSLRLLDLRPHYNEDQTYFYGKIIKPSSLSIMSVRPTGFYLTRKYIDYDTLEEALEAFETELFAGNL